MMNERLSLKILAFGSRITLRRLNDLVKTEDILIVGFSDPEETLSYLEKKVFDLIIVDYRGIDSDAVLRTAFCFAEAPVTVLIDESFTDWRKLRDLPIDGYLPDGAGSTEFIARLKAFLRRKPVYQRILSSDIRN
jgi:DNA-binding response OmpR family regulator